MKLDHWQKEVLKHNGSITIRAGRQVGKSTVIGMKAVQFAQDHPGTTTLIIAASQRQSSLLFEKVRYEMDSLNKTTLDNAKKTHTLDQSYGYRRNRQLEIEYERKHGIYLETPTQTTIILKNGSKIYSLPAGKTGYFIRGFTLDLLIADEAAYIPETVWTAVKPMIAVSRKLRKLGWLILLSTPFGKGGFFYETHHDPDFRQFHISSERCPRLPKDFLRKEKARLSKIEYAQEYLGEFIDEFNQFFPTSLIKKRMTFIGWNYDKDYHPSRYYYYLGLDIARYGADENAFVVLQMNPKKINNNNHMKIVHVATTERKSITDTVGRTLELDKKFNFRKIFTDDTGVGGGVTDLLMEKLGRKVFPINNAQKTVDPDGKRNKIMKEDLYSNASVIIETDGHIDIISNLKLLRSLKSMTFEYTSHKNLRIHGKYSHLSEAFVRALWAKKEKGLKLFVA